MISNHLQSANLNFDQACERIANYQTSWTVIAKLTKGQRFKILSPTKIKPVTFSSLITCISKEESGDKVSLVWLKTFIQTTQESIDQLTDQVKEDAKRFKKASRTAGDLWLVLEKAHDVGLPNLSVSFDNRRDLLNELESLEKLMEKTSLLTLDSKQLAERVQIAKSPSLRDVKSYSQQKPANETLSLSSGFQESLSKIDSLSCLNKTIYVGGTNSSANEVFSELEAQLGKATAVLVSQFLSQATLSEITEAVHHRIVKPSPRSQCYVVEINDLSTATLIVQWVRFSLGVEGESEKYAVGEMVVHIPKDSQSPKMNLDSSCIKIQITVSLLNL